MCSGYVVYTEGGKAERLKIGISEEKISVAYNFLKVSNAELTSGSDYFLYVGRIQKRKGIDVVISAISGTSYKLLIVGDFYDIDDRFEQLIRLTGTQDQIEFKVGTFVSIPKMQTV